MCYRDCPEISVPENAGRLAELDVHARGIRMRSPRGRAYPRSSATRSARPSSDSFVAESTPT